MKGWKKAALVALATAPIGLAILSFVFMARSELAFDEARCPFVEREVRDVADGVRVREQVRTCQPDVEEHRWVVLREGEPDLAIGQRRLSAEHWQGYAWTATLREGHVRLEITDRSQDHPRVFNERRDAGVAAE
ncbi:MAG: hypothetical protein KF729_35100 [Sandaracinaceae bacterium]|nr:hypothetical protein [Sandaracinaceae bacterium]